MNLDKFLKKYSWASSKVTLSINCSDCQNEKKVAKWRIILNIKKNKKYLCQSCGLKKHHADNPVAESTKEKQRLGRLGKSHSAESKRMMSKIKKAYFQTQKGEEERRKLSLLMAEKNSNNFFEKSKRRGLFDSKKNNKMLAYNSSYELRACYLLDGDNTIDSFETQVYFETPAGRARSLDILIHYKDGRYLAVEIKPKKRLCEDAVVEQIKESMEYCKKNGYSFEVWNEERLGMGEREIREWADKFKTENSNDEFDYTEHRKEMDRVKGRRFYDKQIRNNKVQIECAFCNETHEVLKKSYDANIARNARYICEREGGKIAGSKPGKKKVNPYAKQGKKQCNKCQKIKLFAEFGVDKFKSDGLSARCKACRAEASLKRYYDKKG